MRPDNEIKALLQLIDDPDDEVYDTVSSQLLHYGRDIIPQLEQLWEVTIDESVQERIEQLIHRVHFQDLQNEFLDWCNDESPELLRGAILIAKYQFPDLNIPAILSQFDQLRRNVWLELNNYLSALEQVDVFNNMLYNFYKLHGHELTEREPKHFFINQVLESKQGNSYTIGIIYLALCEILDIPIFAVDVPRQFIFAYIDIFPDFFQSGKDVVQQIQFYIDPINGIVYSQKDVNAYLQKLNAKDTDRYFTPIVTKRIIYKMMEELVLCYRYRKDEQRADEISQLMQLLADTAEDDEEED